MTDRNKQKSEEIMASLFSDDTALFRSPSEPERGDSVRIRFRALAGALSRVLLLTDSCAVVMEKTRTDALFDWYETVLACFDTPVSYVFMAQTESDCFIYRKTGASRCADPQKAFDRQYAFRFTPGFHTPAWSRGAVQYQIFTDRFFNGCPENDVRDNEYYYVIGHAKHVTDWNAPPTPTDIRCFYGGDLQGIEQKLDYLRSLGVEVLYLNPIFVSPSSHKYDTQDYEHIDPHLAVIRTDMTHSMQSWEKHNGYAPCYIKRVTAPENLEASDAYFTALCDRIHRLGMRVILDGVFNHCGSFNKWMDREGIYVGCAGYEKGACQDRSSPYRSFFKFNGNANGRGPEYEGWWGYSTLPKLNYEESPELCEAILRIAEKWASPPYSIDGWRLDVAADLGHSEEFNHSFWKEFRKRLKKINPDILILAEHYGNPEKWLCGDEWDTVMNYDAFMEPVTYFFTGMEKHSDAADERLYQNGQAFFDTMLEKSAPFEAPSLACAMNELSNHDHSRFLTRTNRRTGRLDSAGSEAAGRNISKAVFREAVTVQMTWPGAPTVYYADEAGQVGWTDPDCRRTYPWGHEDHDLIALHRELIACRKKYPVLNGASLKPLLAENGAIAYARFNENDRAVIVCNNRKEPATLRVPAAPCGITNGSTLYARVTTNADGFSTRAVPYTADGGFITVTLSPESACLMTND